MKAKSDKPKYLRAKEQLIGEIHDGIYSEGARFPSSRQLASLMDISYVTSNNVISALEQEGYVRRVPGVGTFVCKADTRKKKDDISRVGYFVDVNTSIFGRFFSSVLAQTSGKPFYNIPLRLLPQTEAVTMEEHEAWLQEIFRTQWDSIVIFGDRHFPFKQLKKYELMAGQVNFVFYDDTEVPFDYANRILVDTEKVGVSVARHFLEKGEKRICVLSLRHLDEVYRRRMGVANNDHGTAILNGIEKAYAEAGVDFFSSVKIVPRVLDLRKEVVADVIRGGTRAFFSMGDAWVTTIYEAAADLGLKVGKDIEIIGMNNIPIATMLVPPLSSVSLNEEKVGEALSRAILGKWSGREVRVEPELIIRES